METNWRDINQSSADEVSENLIKTIDVIEIMKNLSIANEKRKFFFSDVWNAVIEPTEMATTNNYSAIH